MIEKRSVSEIVSVASVIIAFLGLFLTKGLDARVQIFAISIVVIAVIFIIFIQVIKTLRGKRSIGSSAVIAKTKKYTKYLYRIAKANGKTLNKLINATDIKRLEKNNKKIINKTMGIKCKEDNNCDKINRKKVKLEEKIKQAYTKRVKTFAGLEELKKEDKLIGLSKTLKLEKAIDITKSIIDKIWDMNRILLQLEQHNLRIKLGKYVVRYSSDFYIQAKGYIDLIGWTYILLGQNKKGYYNIITGINLIECRLEDYKNKLIIQSDNEYYKLLFLKVRALRHLGTTYYTYKSKEVSVDKCLKEALDILDKKDLINHFTDLDTKLLSDEYIKMRQGIINNQIIVDFYKYIESSKKGQKFNKSLDKMYDDTLKAINELDDLDDCSQDKHRKIKLLAIKNQIAKAIEYNGGKEVEETSLKKDLESIEEILNKNIYFDDAMEVYVNLKVQSLYDDVNNILKK